MTGHLKSLVYYALGGLGAFYFSTVTLSAQEQDQEEGNAARMEKSGQGNAYPNFTPPALEQFSVMVQRPLFSQKRRPTNVSQFPPFVPLQYQRIEKPTKTNFLLSGIVFNGDDYVALIKESRAGETLSLSKGETIGGWVVADIKPEEVRLSSGTRISVLSLRDNKMSEAEKQKIKRTIRTKKILAQRKKLTESRKKLNKTRKKLSRAQLYGRGRERSE